eukprot:sb/3470879/
MGVQKSEISQNFVKLKCVSNDLTRDSWKFRISFSKYNMQYPNFQESQVKSFETHFKLEFFKPKRQKSLFATTCCVWSILYKNVLKVICVIFKVDLGKFMKFSTLYEAETNRSPPIGIRVNGWYLLPTCDVTDKFNQSYTFSTSQISFLILEVFGEPKETTKCTRNPGIYFDETLSMESHVSQHDIMTYLTPPYPQ